jgi:hypothetical protein
LDYIDELEAEILRLRTPATATSSGVNHNNQPPHTASKIINNINVNVLIQSFNGQIAPGIFTSIYPGATDPCIMDGILGSDVFCECCILVWICFMPHFRQSIADFSFSTIKLLRRLQYHQASNFLTL